MLFSLQYLRGIASLLVVLYHARGELNDAYAQTDLGNLLFSNGYIGVDLFFMISGFVIMLSTEKDSSSVGFIIKRFFRIYPLYFACLIFFMYIFNKPMDGNFFKALFFINLNLASHAPWFGYTLVYTAWTLMFEVIFYIIFTIAMSISWRYRALICSSIIITTVITLNYFYNNGFRVSGYDAISLPANASDIMLIARVLSSPMFYEFITGMFIYWLYSHIKPSILTSQLTKPLLISSVMVSLLFFFSGYNGGHGLFNCGIFAAILLTSLVIYEKCHSIKHYKSLIFLGDISYSLYLVHPLVLVMLSSGVLVTTAYSPHKGFSNLYFILIICLFASTILYNLIEKRFVLLARRIIAIYRSLILKNAKCPAE